MSEYATTVTETSGTERTLDIEIPRALFHQVFAEKVKKYSKQLRLDGYRKGNIPPRVITERFRDPLTSETLEKLAEDAIRTVCKERSLEPVTPGRVQELRNEGDDPVKLKAVVEVDPPLALKAYQNLGVTIPAPAPVTEAEVEEKLESLRAQHGWEETVEGPAASGDTAEGEYLAIEIDGRLQRLEADRHFHIGVGTDRIPEFNQAFLGIQAGEEKAIQFTFPDDYEAEALRGKSGSYRVRVKAVKRQVLPALDDAFAARMGLADLAALHTEAHRNLEQGHQRDAQRRAEDEAVRKVLEQNPFEVPKSRIREYIRQMRKAYTGKDEGELRDEDIPPAAAEQAAFALQRARILEEVANLENLKPTQEEVDERVRKMAETYQADFEMVKASLRKSGRIMEIREELRTRKAVAFLLGLKFAADADLET